MSDARPRHHISSAIVITRPELAERLCADLARIEGVEVHAQDGGKIVVVIEGPGPGALGETLIQISSMEGVIGAHMVFEQSLQDDEVPHDDRTHAA